MQAEDQGYINSAVMAQDAGCLRCDAAGLGQQTMCCRPCPALTYLANM
jgi:hypothetical protein